MNFLRNISRRVVRYDASSRQALEQQYEYLTAQKKARLQAEVQKRKAQEEDTTKGRHVWFSRYVEGGRFKHWVLAIEDTKYELRRDQTTKKYTANVAPWSIDKERREAALAKQHVPDVDGYYICLIGWTQKQPHELKKICDQVMAEFGSYNIVFNNCQKFLKTFADRVISETALDWPWFRENTKTEYQETQALHIATPDEIIAYQRAAEQNMRTARQANQNLMNAMTQHQHHIVNQTHHTTIQNQINMQNQQQILNNQIMQNTVLMRR
jgi:hypothetical protein